MADDEKPDQQEAGEQKIETAEPQAGTDGLKLPDGLVEALAKAGKDAASMTKDELIAFTFEGNRRFFAEAKSERNKRQTAENQLQELAKLELDKVVGALENKQAKEQLDTLYGAGRKFAAVEETLASAVDLALMSQELADAILEGDAGHAKQVMTLLKKVADMQAKTGAVGVGDDLHPKEKQTEQGKSEGILAAVRDGSHNPGATAFCQSLNALGNRSGGKPAS